MKTTREAAREESHRNMLQILSSLLEKNYDAEKGYKKAIEHADRRDIKVFLKEQAVRRNHFATELDKEIHMLNEHPDSKGNGSVLGNLHKFWMDFRTAITKKEDEALLEECLRGEKVSLKEYERVIEKNILSPRIKTLLETQRDHIKKTISEIKRLEQIAD
ncbi:PA2169 family four-helix-bundle protein [Gramella sp. KN1008]|uniref:ferritin-like domain-containing protein n=1 Tax=Gramella sp. KN1008 TaxID=2529298 RepID=UPI001040A6ED|nr:PA2169 family four-helix-bundle protein [Gramella sp. KN1008]TBW29177.1 PA2169 family four-helix-bundle protein [Gramella sp. KN1008]